MVASHAPRLAMVAGEASGDLLAASLQAAVSPAANALQPPSPPLAMEVATATEKPDMVRYLGQLSVQYGLEASQGSDFHGAHMPWIHLGRFPTLPVECQPVWRRWLPV